MLENRLIKEWQPAGNRKLKRTDRHVFLRCRLDIPYPVLEVAAEPAPGHAVNVGPLGAAPLAARAGRPAHLALPAAPLRPHAQAPRAPVGLRPDGPLRLALPRRPRPERLPPPARPRAGASSSGPEPARRCSTRSTAASRRPQRRAATSAPPRCCAAAGAWPGCSSGSRGSCAPPTRPAADAGPPPGQGALRRLLDRARAARRLGAAARPPRAGRAHRGGAGAPPRARAACPPTRWTSCGSWGAGWPSTSRRAGARSRARRGGAQRFVAADGGCLRGPPARPRSATARSAASKPIREWVLSQNGLVVERAAAAQDDRLARSTQVVLVARPRRSAVPAR